MPMSSDASTHRRLDVLIEEATVTRRQMDALLDLQKETNELLKVLIRNTEPKKSGTELL